MVASSIGQSAPKAITANTIELFSPNRTMKTGIVADAGRGRRNSSVGVSKRRKIAELPIRLPSVMPTTDAKAQPTSMRHTVA